MRELNVIYNGYRNLHLHTDASHLDGLNDIPRLMKRLKEIGHDACAITDHGNAHNALKFYRACIENGIKPIIGFEAYTFHDRRLQSKAQIEELVEQTGDDFIREEFHLVLLAKSFKGYQNLLKLTTLGYTEGFYRRPHIDFEDLKEYSEGVICINGHVGTDVAKAIERHCIATNNGNKEVASRELTRAYDLAAKYMDVFGDDYYLEIQNHGLNIEADTNPIMIQIAQELGVKLVMTNDSHYTWRTDADPHRAHMSNGIGKTYAEFMGGDFEGFATCDEFYVKSDDEMLEMALPYGDAAVEALNNTFEIVEKCDLMIDAIEYLGSSINAKGKVEHKWKQKEYLFPDFPVPAPYTSLESYFRFLAEDGLRQRHENGELGGIELGVATWGDYCARLQYEIDVVLNMGFPTYFIILEDVMRFCREKEIPVGKGRGSGAGSLVLYSMQITDVDPIPYNLIFERFLNPDRISLPDVDSDFCYDRIDEVIEYVKEKYGNEYVCKIGTFGTLGARAVIKDTARVFDYPYEKINSFTRQIVGIDIKIKDIYEKYAALVAQYESDEDGEVFKRIMTVSTRLEGLQRHTSQHAAALVISPFPLVQLVPLKGESYDLTAQWEMGDIELLGFVKMDFLRLRTLTIIKNTTNAIKRQSGLNININKIDFNDEKVYAEFQKGNSLGIFQFESDGMQALLKRHKPKNLEDLAADNALYRPGPMDAKVEDETSPHFGKTMMDVYVERASGQAEVEFDHPLLQEVQGDTYGVFVYQEQVMKGSVVLANFTLPESDELRKVVGKKLMDKMPIQKEKFINGCLRNDRFLVGCENMGKVAREVAEMIWNQIETFGRYGFNKSHSTAYAILAYQSMWLKVYYPAFFMASVLTSWMGKKIDQIVPYLNECRKMGISILPPDINHSSNRFEVSRDGDGIHFGLVGIQGVGEKAVENILEIKQRHEIRSLLDFMMLTGSSVNRTVIMALIKCGAFDFLGYNRRTLLQAAEDLLEINAKVKTRINSNKKRKNPVSDISVFYDRLYEYNIKPLDEFDITELCQMERDLTGFYMAHHPLDGLIEYIRSKATHTAMSVNIGNLVGYETELDENDIPVGDPIPVYEQIPKGQTIITGGVIKSLNEITIKNGRSKGKVMCSFILEDAYQGDIKCTAFHEVYSKCRLSLREGSVVFIQGTVDYYRENAQVNVNNASVINRDVAKAFNLRHKRDELASQLKEVEADIKLAEEILDSMGEDYDMVSAVSEELLVLYDKRDEIRESMEEYVV